MFHRDRVCHWWFIHQCNGRPSSGTGGQATSATRLFQQDQSTPEPSRVKIPARSSDVGEFVAFCGIEHPDEFRSVSRAHLIAFRGTLEARGLAASTVRRKLYALSSLFEHLCDRNTITHNPVAGVKRRSEDMNEGKIPALSDDQARELLRAPEGDSLKAVRDRAILATYLFHALRRSELADLRVSNLRERRAVVHEADR